MKITGSRVERFLTQIPDDIHGVLLFGPDRGLARERAQSLAQNLVPDFSDPFALTALTADDLQKDPAKLSDELSAMSLLGDARLIRLRLEHEKSGAAIAKIIRSFDSHPEKCAAKLIVEAGEMTGGSAIRKAFEAAKHFAAIGCYADTVASLSGLIKSALKEKNIQIEKDALEAWAPLLEGDRGLARAEIEKMMLYKGYGLEGPQTVTLNDIRTIAAGAQSHKMDDIIYATLSGQVDMADDNFRRAINGKMNAAVILRTLQRHITQLQEAMAAMQSGKSADEAMRGLRPPIFIMKQRAFSAQLRLWTPESLGKALAQSLTTEKRVKTAGAPVESLVGRLLIALSTYAQRRKR